MVKCEICEKETDSPKTLGGKNLCESCFEESLKSIGPMGCCGCGGGCWL